MKDWKISPLHCGDCSKELLEKLEAATGLQGFGYDAHTRLLHVPVGADEQVVRAVLDADKVALQPKEAEKKDAHDHGHHHHHGESSSTRNIAIVFAMNLIFSVAEFIFGALLNSTAIFADAVHDLGDALSVGLAFFLEKKSKKHANRKYTFGHRRFSLLGALITGVVLIVGSLFALGRSLPRLLRPEAVNYDGMLVMAVLAIALNAVSAWALSRGSSRNESMLNLHMLEDMVGWIGILIISLVLRVKPWYFLDPLMSVGISVFILVKAVQGCIDELKTIYNWSEEPFDEDYYDTHEYVAGDIEELSKHGVVAEYLPTLQALKKEIKAYLDWAQPKLDAGTPESDLTLFSTVNLHIFQSYYGGLRQSADKSSWIWGDVDLVSQFIEDGQDLKPWLESMGSTFVEDTQPTLIGALWYRENQFIGANVDTDGDGQTEEYAGRWGTYFVAPMTSFLNANEHNQIMTRTTAEELIQEDGRVTGVKATMYDGTPVTAHAKKGVVLATGGYAANIAKVVETNKYWDPEYLNDKTETTNRSSLQGDGITMAEAVGAATTGMGYTQLMPISWVDNGDLAFGGGDYAVYINPTTGKRFVDETSERDVLSLGEFRNGIEWNGHKGVFIEIANAATPIPGPYPYKDEDVEGRQYVRTIGEIADVLKAEGFDTDVETIKATIEDYDQAIINGTQPQDVSKKQFSALIGDCEKNEDGSYKADTYNLDDAKLRIRFLAPSTHHTMGGISVDVKRHVLDADGKAIDGLYAAGEVTGGIHGGNRLGGNAITEIFVSGRTAANAISEDNK